MRSIEPICGHFSQEAMNIFIILAFARHPLESETVYLACPTCNKILLKVQEYGITEKTDEQASRQTETPL